MVLDKVRRDIGRAEKKKKKKKPQMLLTIRHVNGPARLRKVCVPVVLI